MTQEKSAYYAKQLLQIKAIKLSPQNPFTWASGIQSPIYCDNRIILSHPSLRTSVIEGLAILSEDFAPFDKIAGVATAGIAHGALLAHQLELPFVYVRSKAKGHGRQNKIEGEIKAGERLLVVEDLISTGGSCIQAIDALREADCQVTGAVAIFTYGFKRAEQAFQEAGCPFNTLTNFPVLLEEAVQSNYISASEIDSLKNWQADPEQWAASV